MNETWAGTGTSKADQLALAVNRLLGNAVLLCSKGDDRVHDYFDVGIIGYAQGAAPVLHGSTAERPLLSIGELARNPKRVDPVIRKVSDGAGGLVEAALPVPVWVDPMSDGWTPMVKAVELAESVISQWCREHPRSFPPIVINVTDGASTDGDPRPEAARVRATATGNGETMLFNVHLAAGPRQQVAFAASAEGLPDRNAAMLFDMSSPLPPPMISAAKRLGYQVDEGARGFLYNAEATALIEFLDIGTRAVTPTGLRELTSGSDSMR